MNTLDGWSFKLYNGDMMKLTAEKFIGYSNEYDLDTTEGAKAHLLLEVLELTGLTPAKAKIKDFGFEYTVNASDVTVVNFVVEWELKDG